MVHRPSWFQDDIVVISNAPTCGINKDGAEQFQVDPETGQRSKTEIDDRLYDDAVRITNNDYSNGNVSIRPLETVLRSKIYVPQFHDLSSIEHLEIALKELPGFKSKSLGELRNEGKLKIFFGHGSPSSDQRVGDVPYIKVSDLRAGHVNVNPSNLIPLDLAKKFWRGEESGLEPYDLISPQRASKNIGEFSVLLPGQESIVLTKEVVGVRSTAPDLFDQFYLLWALTLNVVREQWGRVILMQTNREDVGSRMLEIRIPVPPTYEAGVVVSQPFRKYYRDLEQVRRAFITELASDPLRHHFFVGQ